MRKKGLMLAILFCMALSMNALQCLAQEETTMDCNEKQMVFKQKSANGDTTRMTMSFPEYPGGMDELYDYLDTSVTYPETLKSGEYEGTTTVQFVVGSDGEISEVSVFTSSGYPEMDDEAVRVVQNFPNWTPAKKNGEAFAMKTQIPIHFAYYGDDED